MVGSTKRKMARFEPADAADHGNGNGDGHRVRHEFYPILSSSTLHDPPLLPLRPDPTKKREDHLVRHHHHHQEQELQKQRTRRMDCNNSWGDQVKAFHDQDDDDDNDDDDLSGYDCDGNNEDDIQSYLGPSSLSPSITYGATTTAPSPPSPRQDPLPASCPWNCTTPRRRQQSRPSVPPKLLSISSAQGQQLITNTPPSRQQSFLTLTSFPFRILHASEVYTKITGRPVSEILCRPLFDMFVADGKPHPTMFSNPTPLGNFEWNIVRLKAVSSSPSSSPSPAPSSSSSSSLSSDSPSSSSLQASAIVLPCNKVCRMQVQPVYYPSQAEQGKGQGSLQYYVVHLEELPHSGRGRRYHSIAATK